MRKKTYHQSRCTTVAGKLLALLIAALPVAALAADDVAPGFVWSVEGQARYDDNVYRTNNRTESDGSFVLRPELAWIFLRGQHQFDLDYKGDYVVYLNESQLDYTGHQFGAHALLDHSARFKTDYTLGFEKTVDQPGANSSVNLPGETPDKWENSSFAAQANYGNPDSRGQLVGRLNYNQKRYTNKNQEFRDYDGNGGTGTFYYQIAPRTRLLFELDYIDYDYQNQDRFGFDQSSKQTRYLSGVTWEASGKTTGVFKIGYRDRQYENDQFDDLTGLYLSLDGIWEPTEYTSVTLTASQDNQDSAQQASGGFVQTEIKTNVVYGISPRTRLIGALGFRNEDFKGQFDREDERWNLSLGVQYSLLYWLDIGAEYQYGDRDSTIDVFDFTANMFMINVVINFDD